MTRAKDVYYVATPLKHVKSLPPDCYTDRCFNCNAEVVITEKMKMIVKQAKAIICVPDVMELTGKSLEELVYLNEEVMTEILDKEIAKMQKKRAKK